MEREEIQAESRQRNQRMDPTLIQASRPELDELIHGSTSIDCRHGRETQRTAPITSDRIAAYVAFRKTEGAANATINRELGALHRMFRLGKRAGKIGELPFISLLQEDNVRRGFFEPEQFRAVLRHLPDDLKPVVEVAYVTGWRVPSEVLTRQWQRRFRRRMTPSRTRRDEEPRRDATSR